MTPNTVLIETGNRHNIYTYIYICIYVGFTCMVYWFNLYGLGYMRLYEYPITASIRQSFAQTS